LRTLHSPAQYVGIEIELNQAIVARAPREWRWLRELIVRTIADALA
jgi:hypothetical protein